MFDVGKAGRALALGASLLARSAWAGPLVVTPTTVTLAPDRHSAIVEVENVADEPVDLQFRAYDWSQPDGQDRLTPTDALVVSPSIATVPAHVKQVFRVLQIDEGREALPTERSYRLRLNQLPHGDRSAVTVLLEFSIPVFQGRADAMPRLSWALGPEAITVTNTGGRRARVTRLALQSPGGAAVPIVGATSTYLLSGASRTFPLPGPAAPSAGARLFGTVDKGTIDAMPRALATR